MALIILITTCQSQPALLRARSPYQTIPGLVPNQNHQTCPNHCYLLKNTHIHRAVPPGVRPPRPPPPSACTKKRFGFRTCARSPCVRASAGSCPSSGSSRASSSSSPPQSRSFYTVEQRNKNKNKCSVVRDTKKTALSGKALKWNRGIVCMQEQWRGHREGKSV